MTEPQGAGIDRDALDTWMRERGLMLIRQSYFDDLTRQLAEARQTATRLHEENDRLRNLITREPDRRSHNTKHPPRLPLIDLPAD